MVEEEMVAEVKETGVEEMAEEVKVKVVVAKVKVEAAKAKVEEAINAT